MHPFFRGTWGHKIPPVQLDDRVAFSWAFPRPGKALSWWRGGLPPQCIILYLCNILYILGIQHPMYHRSCADKWGKG